MSITIRPSWPRVRNTAPPAPRHTSIVSASPGNTGELNIDLIHTDYGKPGDPKKPARIVQIVFREDDGKMLFLPDKLKFKKGEQVRFQLRNNGAIDHEFVVGTVEENLKHMKDMEKNPDMEHDDPNAKRLKPKGTGEIVWQFTKAGKFDFSCLIPGHREAGMFGTITVQ